MSQSVTDKKTFTNNEIIRGLILAFVIGGGIARFEYKTDKISNDQQVIKILLEKQLEKYIMSNDYELKIIRNELADLKEETTKLSSGSLKNSFIKPEEPTIRRNGREYK